MKRLCLPNAVLACCLASGLAVTVGHAAGASQGACQLVETCAPDVVCGAETVTLTWDWTGGGANVIRIGDDQFTVIPGEPDTLDSFNVSGVSYTIVSPRPILQLASDNGSRGFAISGEDPGAVTLTLFSMPRRYVDYPEAMAARGVFSGRCEGLF